MSKHVASLSRITYSEPINLNDKRGNFFFVFELNGDDGGDHPARRDVNKNEKVKKNNQIKNIIGVRVIIVGAPLNI